MLKESITYGEMMEAKWLKALFPRCAEQLGDGWDALIAGLGEEAVPEALPECLESAVTSPLAYLPDLARLELALHELQATTAPSSPEEGAICRLTRPSPFSLCSGGIFAAFCGTGNLESRLNRDRSSCSSIRLRLRERCGFVRLQTGICWH